MKIKELKWEGKDEIGNVIISKTPIKNYYIKVGLGAEGEIMVKRYFYHEEVNGKIRFEAIAFKTLEEAKEFIRRRHEFEAKQTILKLMED